MGLYESRELTEATMKYVAGLKLTYPALNERDLYELVYEVARQRVEEAQKVVGIGIENMSQQKPSATLVKGRRAEDGWEVLRSPAPDALTQKEDFDK